METTSDTDQRFRRLARVLVDDVDRLAAGVAEEIRGQFPEWTVDRPELWELVKAGAGESIGAELRALADGARPPERCPAIDAEGARVAARAEVPLTVLLHLYRLGHSAQWEAWFDAVEQHESDPGVRRHLLASGSRFFFAYVSRLSGFVTDEYTRERDLLLRDREQRRAHLVRELLEGARVDAEALGYELDSRHVGAVAWGAEATASLRALGAAARCELLVVGLPGGTSWGWIALSDPAAGEISASAFERAARPGTALAVGSEAPGLEGFRRTHRQAVAAQRIALRTGAALTRYEDAALEALVLRDEHEAAALARRELAGIDGDDARSKRLRATLAAYLAAGHNAAATAATLRVHEQTVAHRLRVIEERIGHPVTVRRAELELALRLREKVGDRPPLA